MTTPEEQKNCTDTAHEGHADPTAPYQYGILGTYLIELVTDQRKPFETKAYIEDKGIVLITNRPGTTETTIKGEPKIKNGVNLTQVPDSIVYLKIDTFSQLMQDKKDAYCHLRKPKQSTPPRSLEYRQKLVRDDLEPILRKTR